MQVKSIPMMIGTTCRAAVILSVLIPGAFADDPGHGKKLCSMETFKGDYGFTVSGVVLPGGGVSLPIQGVQMIHSDGKGNLTDNESLLVDGAPLAGSNGLPLGNPPGYFSEHAGTYSLNSNCTGTANLTNGFNFVNLSFVVDKKGKQIRMVVVPPYDSGGIPRVVTSIGERVEEPTEEEWPR